MPRETHINPRPSSHRAGIAVRAVLLGLPVVLALSVVVALLAFHGWAEQKVRDKLHEVSQRYGWHIDSADVELLWNGDVEVRDIVATGPDGGELRAESVLVAVDFDSVVSGRPRPTSVTLDNFSASVSPHDLLVRPEGPSDARSTTTRRLPALLAHRGTVEVALPGIGTPLVVDDISVDGRPASNGEWNARFVADCQQGCGPASGQTLRGSCELGAENLLEVDLDQPLSLPLEDLGFPGTKARASSLRVRWDGRGAVRMGAGNVDFKGTIDGIALSGSARAVDLRATGGLRSLMSAVGSARSGKFDLNDVDVEEIRVVRPSATVTLAETNEPTKKKGRRDRRARDQKIRQKLIGLLARLPTLQPVTVEKGRVVVAHGGRRVALDDVSSGALPDGNYAVSMGVLRGQVTVTLSPSVPQVRAQLDRIDVVALRELLPKFAESYVVAGRVDGQVRLGWGSDDDPWELDGDLTVRRPSLQRDGLAPGPVTTDWVRVTLAADYRGPRSGDRINVEHLSVELPSRDGRSATAHLEGRVLNLSGRRPRKIALKLWLDDTPCDVAIGAIPHGMMPNLRSQLKVTGRFAPRIDFSVNMADTASVKLKIRDMPGTCRIDQLGRYDPSYLADDFEQEVRQGVSREGIMIGPASGSWTPLARIPEHVGASMYLTEEASFYRNKGFGVGLIRRALKINLNAGRFVYGGSTVSQQLVKNLFLTRDKTLSRKLEEAFIVWKMEEVLDKDRILELYVNCIEFGPDLYGITRASKFYFGVSPSRLTPMQGAFLASLKPAPWNGPKFKDRGHTPAKGWWHKRLTEVMRRLHEYEHIDTATWKADAPYVLFFPGHDWEDHPELAAMRATVLAAEETSEILP